MTILTLTKEAQTVVEEAQWYAEQRHHPVLDGPHLFRALLRHSEAGRDWLEDTMANEALVRELEAAFEQWYGSDSQETEPSSTYILIMRAAQEAAAESGSVQITSSHLLKAVLTTDEILNDWLEDHGIRSTAIVIASPTPLLDECRSTRLAPGELPDVIGAKQKSVSW